MIQKCRLIAILFLLMVVAWIFTIYLLKFIPIPYTNVMLYKFISKPENGIHYQWVSEKNIAKTMKVAVVKSEDDLFYEHHGFDFKAIAKAIKYNKTHKKQKGASTISQQTAKNVFLTPSRSFIRKGMEVFLTVMIEWLWGKERILEVYLNVIEFGPGIYGVASASEFYFHKKASSLTADEAGLLTAVLPNPIIYQVNKPSRYVLKRKHIITSRIKKTLFTTPTPTPVAIAIPDRHDLKFDEDENDDVADTVNSDVIDVNNQAKREVIP